MFSRTKRRVNPFEGRAHIQERKIEPVEVIDEVDDVVIGTLMQTEKKNGKPIIPFMRALKRLQRQRLAELEEKKLDKLIDEKLGIKV